MGKSGEALFMLEVASRAFFLSCLLPPLAMRIDFEERRKIELRISTNVAS